MARVWQRRYDPADPVLDRVRQMVAHLPQIHEEETWGVLTLRVGPKLFGIYAGGIKGATHEVTFKPDPSEAVWLRADPRFHMAAHFNPWLTLDLDQVGDWTEVTELLTDSYRQVAPKALARLVDQIHPPPAQ
jgi:predicted DNA-binding protein (MmcQ/YjbR family)